MSDIIKLLPESLANQIAAGEVAPSPCYVVKELLENAVDAGATHIKLEVSDGGKAYIHVIDNGKGMSPSDARMAFERHATSKISSLEDLQQLRTMGFRGEALAAISAISQIELRTRRAEDELGTELVMSGSELVSINSCVVNKGTSIKVKDIFFNTPARRRFLKSSEVEYRAIVTEFDRIALVNPSINLSLYKDGVLVKELEPSTHKKRILDVCAKGKEGRKKLEEDLLSVDYKSLVVNISGYVGKPSGAKKGYLAKQYFFVNGRYMKSPQFHKAVMTAFEGLIPAGYQPNYFLYFDAPTENIDVNIHPTKTEVRFSDADTIFGLIRGLVREAHGAHAALPMLALDEPRVLDIPVYRGREEVSAPTATPTATGGISRRVFGSGSTSMPSLPPLGHRTSFRSGSSGSSYDLDWDQLSSSFAQEGKAASHATSSAQAVGVDADRGGSESLFTSEGVQEVSSPISGHEYFIHKGRYIVASLGRNVAFIEVRRANARLLYDQYIQDIESSRLEIQPLLFPEELHFSEAEVGLASEILQGLRPYGFAIEPAQEAGAFIIREVPSILAHNVADLLRIFVMECMDSGLSSGQEMLEHLACILAERNARQHSMPSSASEVERLQAKLFASSDPNRSPAGKRIIFMISESELDNYFA